MKFKSDSGIKSKRRSSVSVPHIITDARWGKNILIGITLRQYRDLLYELRVFPAVTWLAVYRWLNIGPQRAPVIFYGRTTFD